MGNDFDKSKPEKYLLYLDANNLYGYRMSKPFPIGEYKWMEEWELTRFKNQGFSMQGEFQ